MRAREVHAEAEEAPAPAAAEEASERKPNHRKIRCQRLTGVTVILLAIGAGFAYGHTVVVMSVPQYVLAYGCIASALHACPRRIARQ